MDMSAADKRVFLHVRTQCFASHVHVIADFIQRLKRGRMAEQNIVNVRGCVRFGIGKNLLNLFLGKLKRGVERRRIRSADTRNRDIADGHGRTVKADGVRFFESIENFFGIAVTRDCKAGHVELFKELLYGLAGSHIREIAGNKRQIRL